MEPRRKQIVMMTGKDRSRRDMFQQDVLEAARKMLPVSEDISRLVVNFVDLPPTAIPYRPATELVTDDHLPAYDVVVEMTGAIKTARAVDAIALSAPCDTWHAFTVEEHIEKDEQPITPGGRSPGIKYMGRLMFHADLPDSAARRSWALHVPLALRVHAGASKYVRNWVVDREGDSVPETRGISELHFRSLDDLVERFFDSEHGKAEVLHDLAHFVASGNRLYCSEYVLKA